MVKRIAGLAAVCAAVMCLCACEDGAVTINKEMREYETDYMAVKAEIISFSGMPNKEFEEGLNSSIAKDAESGIIAFDTNAEASGDNVRMGNKCVYETLWQTKYNENEFVSVVEERYVYMGGAHGETAWLPKNIDVRESKEVKLADLFEDEGYVNTLNRLITAEVQENSGEYADLWEKPQIKDTNQTDFYIEDGELVIFYQPYDLSYYARGFVEFKLDLEELSGYLKEEYRRLID